MAGSVLHVCSGKSEVGDVRVDLTMKCDVKADMMSLPFKDQSFDTVICDPPWQYFLGKWRAYANFMFELRRVARLRIVVVIDNLHFDLKGWKDTTFVLRSNFGFFVKLLIIYDREQQRLD